MMGICKYLTISTENSTLMRRYLATGNDGIVAGVSRNSDSLCSTELELLVNNVGNVLVCRCCL